MDTELFIPLVLDISFLIGIGCLIVATVKHTPLYLVLASVFMSPFVFLYLSGNPGFGWTRIVPVAIFITGAALYLKARIR